MQQWKIHILSCSDCWCARRFGYMIRHSVRWGGNVGDGWETRQVLPLFLSNKWNLGIVGDEPDGYLKYQQEAERLILFMKQIYQRSGPFSFFHLHKHAAQQAPSFVFSSANKRQQKWKKLALRPKGIVSKVTGSPRKTDVIAFSCLKLHDNKTPRFLWFVTSSNTSSLWIFLFPFYWNILSFSFGCEIKSWLKRL